MSPQNNAAHLKLVTLIAKAVLFDIDFGFREIVYVIGCGGDILQLYLKQSSLVIIYKQEHLIAPKSIKSSAYIAIITYIKYFIFIIHVALSFPQIHFDQTFL
jgi:hypothetical protein